MKMHLKAAPIGLDERLLVVYRIACGNTSTLPMTDDVRQVSCQRCLDTVLARREMDDG